jgi:hypothetical protein
MLPGTFSLSSYAAIGPPLADSIDALTLAAQFEQFAIVEERGKAAQLFMTTVGEASTR